MGEVVEEGVVGGVGVMGWWNDVDEVRTSGTPVAICTSLPRTTGTLGRLVMKG